MHTLNFAHQVNYNAGKFGLAVRGWVQNPRRQEFIHERHENHEPTRGFGGVFVLCACLSWTVSSSARILNPADWYYCFRPVTRCTAL
jgi:hypothetical protein